MFGLSLTKVVLLILVIGAVIYGTRLFRTLSRPDTSGSRERGSGGDAGGTTTFEQCPRCGAYVDPAQHRCGADGDDRGPRGPG
jgi:hypothetical protein